MKKLSPACLVTEKSFQLGLAKDVQLNRKKGGRGGFSRKSVAKGVAVGEHGVCSLPGRASRGSDLNACFVDTQAVRRHVQ